MSRLAVPAALTAAVQRVTGRDRRPTRTGSDGSWKAEAWQRFDEVGELRYVCQWYENSLSRVRLFASDIDPATGRPTGTSEDPDATRLVRMIAGGPAGQAAMLGRLATFLTVPGEGWIAIIHRDTNADGITEEWHVLSDSEIREQSGRVTITLPDGEPYELDDELDDLFRLWRPHPRRSNEADSPVRACLPVLREIVRQTQTIEAAGRSRVAGNGILFLPDEMRMPAAAAPVAQDPDAPGLPAPEPTGDRAVTASDIMGSIQAAMTASIQDQASPAAMVPIVVSAKGDALAHIKHLKLGSEASETALKTREAAIRRLALSLDVPAEVLLGIGQTNHWSAWAVDAAAVRTHIAPLMTLICDQLTEAVLRPMLRETGHPDPESVTLWFDTSELTLTTDRAEDATAAFDRKVISADTYRREMGFGDDDKPDSTSDEGLRDLAVQMVQAAPSLLPYLADVLGFDLPDLPTHIGGAPGDAPTAPSSGETPATSPDGDG